MYFSMLQCRRKQIYVEQTEQLQHSFTTLQDTCEKRERVEKQLRLRLEKEIEELKEQTSNNTMTDDSPAEPKTVYSLKQLINEKEAKSLKFEAEALKVKTNEMHVLLQSVTEVVSKMSGAAL